MNTYICKINSTAGRKGSHVQRDPRASETQQLLDAGIIYEAKVVHPAETKTTRKLKNASTDK